MLADVGGKVEYGY